MTLYATGVRRAELTHLKSATSIAKRMVIHVQGGKGRKDRDVMLSPKLLEALREHWRGLPRFQCPSAWLFPGNRFKRRAASMANCCTIIILAHAGSRRYGPP